MQPLISIIVPVYNVEQYLRECIESLKKQTYSNVEIILVDDGSKDQSSTICDDLAMEDERIHAFHKTNGGLSDARNFGIEKSNGIYISFVDSDDIVSADFIQSMYDNITANDVKIAACGYCHYYDSGDMVKINFDGINKYYDNYEAQKYLNIIGYFNVSACNKLFYRDLFKSIFFPVGKKSEDWYVMYLLIEAAGGIYYNSQIKYFYRQRQGSITKSININYDCIDAAKEVYNYYSIKSLKGAIPYAAQSLVFAYIGVYNAHLCNTNNKVEMKIIRAQVLIMRKDITFNELSRSRKLQLLLFLNSKVLYNIAFKLFDKRRKYLEYRS